MTSAGAETNDADNVSVINSLPITHFDKIELKMNDTVVTDSSAGNHACHAYIAQKNSYGRNVKKEILKRTECYYEEEPDKMKQFALAVTEADQQGNTKPIKDTFREKHDFWVKNAKDLVTRTQLYLDLCNVNQYYPTDITP